jgi:hypothetical protein
VVPAAAGVKPPAPASAVFERPNPASTPDDYPSLSDDEVSFASVAPPPAQPLAGAGPRMKSQVRPSGRPTPPRTEIARPASSPPAAPFSESEIRISFEEEEP